MSTENEDVIDEKCIRGDDDNISLDDALKQQARKQNYKQLLNNEFSWSKNLPHVDPVVVPANSKILDAHEWESREN